MYQSWRQLPASRESWAFRCVWLTWRQRAFGKVGGAIHVDAVEIDSAVPHGAKAVCIVSNSTAWHIERYDQDDGAGGRLVDTTLRHSDKPPWCLRRVPWCPNRGPDRR